MKPNNTLLLSLKALINVLQTLFKKMPILFLVLIYLIDLASRGYISAGFSTISLLGVLILLISIVLYVSTKSFAETTLSFILGILTIYTIDWKTANITLFIILYLIYMIIVFYISCIRLGMRQETILTQAASKLDMKNHKDVYKRLKRISQLSTTAQQLSIIDKSEVVRYLAFRKVNIGEYEEAIRLVELIKTVCQMDLISCCEIYYSFYTYCYNQTPTLPNIAQIVENMFDKVTTLTVAYHEFFEIFTNTKRILVEKKLTYDAYLQEIKLLSFSGYSSNDIIEQLKEKHLN